MGSRRLAVGSRQSAVDNGAPDRATIPANPCRLRRGYSADTQRKGKKIMDKNIVDGKVKQVEGRVENIAGAVTNDLGQQIAGKAKEAAGKVQEEFGKAKDEVRREVRKADDA